MFDQTFQNLSSSFVNIKKLFSVFYDKTADFHQMLYKFEEFIDGYTNLFMRIFVHFQFNLIQSTKETFLSFMTTIISNELKLYMSESEFKMIKIDEISLEIINLIDSIFFGLLQTYLFDSALQMRNLQKNQFIYTQIIAKNFEIDKKYFN